MFDMIKEQVEGKGIHAVKKISLEIGQLAAVDESALRFGFEIVLKDTFAEGAVLDIIVVEGLAVCTSCHEQVKLQTFYDPCLSCGQFTLNVIQGEELRLKSMEVV
jgi:hydrogenase nickel incorporation protein HypA/HybF